MTDIGVYQIKNLKNDKVYIGSSDDISRRWSDHKSELNRGVHHSRHLQNAWNKYDKSLFQFSIVVECDESRLEDYEQYWIDRLQSYKRENGYNIHKFVDKTKLRGPDHPRWKGGKITLECRNCGKEYKRKRHQRDRSKYCDVSCQWEDQVNQEGENNSFYGKTHSEENKKKWSEQAKGENGSNAKLTKDNVIEIKKLLKNDNWTQKEIADKFDVSKSCIEHIAYGKNWTHVEI